MLMMNLDLNKLHQCQVPFTVGQNIISAPKMRNDYGSKVITLNLFCLFFGNSSLLVDCSGPKGIALPIIAIAIIGRALIFSFLFAIAFKCVK